MLGAHKKSLHVHIGIIAFLPEGVVELDIEFFLQIELPPVARLGLQHRLHLLKKVTWQGRGPHENYPDRYHSALLVNTHYLLKTCIHLIFSQVKMVCGVVFVH